MPPGDPAAFGSDHVGGTLGQLDLGGLLAATAAIVLNHEGDLVALVEAVDASALERAHVKKHVLRAIGRLNEAKALGEVEELHGASDTIHKCIFPTGALTKPIAARHAIARSLSDLGKANGRWRA